MYIFYLDILAIDMGIIIMVPFSICITFAILTICIPLSIKKEQMYIYRYLLVQVKTKPTSILCSYRKRIQILLFCWIVFYIRKIHPVIRNIHPNVFDLFIPHNKRNVLFSVHQV